ncbi:MAG: YebC/PmpR family DNA-binding transcriptional regulator [Gracilibacteraceae bacterium]|nr:YebC/PmpR family DNA-binding transcriptional regulator [Gracilibacteraceae bacterium]
MSGHSKWANIKHKKARTDAVKGRIFTKMAREIMVAAKAGGGDPNGNFRLKIAIDNAKAANLPGDNIQRAIQKGVGGGEGTIYEELRYEGYAPGGVAVMVDIMTDNRNRTAGEVRHIFTKNGGNLGETGCVNWMFREQGQITVSRADCDWEEDDFLLAALEAGAEEVESDEDEFEVLTAPAELETVRDALLRLGLKPARAALNLAPDNRVEIDDAAQARKVIKLIDALDEHDDTQNVYTNFELSDRLNPDEL